MNLTEIRNAPAGAILKDDQVRGLELHKREADGSWMLYYRTKSGQRRRPKIADYPSLTLQQAREIAREWLGEVARGNDPSIDRKGLRASATVKEAAEAWLADRKGNKAVRHDEGRVRNIVIPAWGSRKLVDVHRADVMDLRRSMADRPVAFNRTLPVINGIWKLAELESPAKGVKMYPEVARRRYLTEDEALRLAKAFDEVEPIYPEAVAVLRLLALTGARVSEIVRARRDQYRDKVLSLPVHKTDEKMGARTIVFSDAADAVVQRTKPRRGWLVGFSSYPWDAWTMVREKAALEDFPLHSLRHSFASDALGAGFTLDQIGEVLGHRDAATTRRYAHLNEERQRKIAEAVALKR